MHVYMGPGPWPWIVVGVVVFMVLRRRRRGCWGLGRRGGWAERVGRRGRSGRGSETPWWREPVPEPGTDGDGAGPAAGAARGGAGRETGEAGTATGRSSSPGLLTEQTLESLQREYVEGRLGVDEYEKALDALYAKRRGR